jgi:hypothetical protein
MVCKIEHAIIIGLFKKCVKMILRFDPSSNPIFNSVYIRKQWKGGFWKNYNLKSFLVQAYYGWLIGF